MGTGRTFNKAPRTRPRKSQGERRRREKVQKTRLAALGVPEEKLRTMTAKDIRTQLKTPVKTAASVAS